MIFAKASNISRWPTLPDTPGTPRAEAVVSPSLEQTIRGDSFIKIAAPRHCPCKRTPTTLFGYLTECVTSTASPAFAARGANIVTSKSPYSTTIIFTLPPVKYTTVPTSVEVGPVGLDEDS